MRISALLLALAVAAPGAASAGEFLDFCSARHGGETEQIYVDGRIADELDWRRDCIREVTLEANTSDAGSKSAIVVSMLIVRPGADDEERGRLWMTFDIARLKTITSDSLTVKTVGWTVAQPTPDDDLDVDESGWFSLPPATLRFLQAHQHRNASNADGLHGERKKSNGPN
jgi:hypothetical protein